MTVPCVICKPNPTVAAPTTWDLREGMRGQARQACEQAGEEAREGQVLAHMVSRWRHDLALEIFNIWVWARVGLEVGPGRGRGTGTGTGTGPETGTGSGLWEGIADADAICVCGYLQSASCCDLV